MKATGETDRQSGRDHSRTDSRKTEAASSRRPPWRVQLQADSLGQAGCVAGSEQSPQSHLGQGARLTGGYRNEPLPGPFFPGLPGTQQGCVGTSGSRGAKDGDFWVSMLSGDSPAAAAAVL